MAKQEVINHWLNIANKDLESAKILMKNMYPAPFEIICYHCQQAAEKFLKCISASLGMEVVKTHDILKVLDQYVNQIEIPQEIVVIAGTLTQFATKTRYPEIIELDEDTTKLAITQAEQVKIWTEKIIAEKSSDQNNKEDDTTNNPTD